MYGKSLKVSNSYSIMFLTTILGECSGSVVECVTGDQGATGLSLTGVTALCP